MFKAYISENDALKEIDPAHIENLRNNILWLDIVNPTLAEEHLIETWFGLDIPTKDEMTGIQLSSHLHQKNNNTFMTFTMANLEKELEKERATSHNISLILHQNLLITVRYADIYPFTDLTFLSDVSFSTGKEIFSLMLSAILEKLTDTLEVVAHKIEKMTAELFRPQNVAIASVTPKKFNFKTIICRIGSYQNLLTQTQGSLFSINKLVNYCGNIGCFIQTQNVNNFMDDLPHLLSQADFLGEKISFLLDSTLGLINVEQNFIIQVFSIASVIFLPPTLIAAIYGMNFKTMPEISWSYGYPLVLGIMLLTGILPYKFIRHKGWL